MLIIVATHHGRRMWLRRLLKRRTYYQRQSAVFKAPLHKMPPTPYPAPRRLRRWETLANEVVLSDPGHRHSALLTMVSLSSTGDEGGLLGLGAHRPPAAEDSVRMLNRVSLSEDKTSATPHTARSGSAEAAAAEAAAAEASEQEAVVAAPATLEAVVSGATAPAEDNATRATGPDVAAVVVGEGEEVPLRSKLQQWQRSFAPDLVYRLAALEMRARAARRLRKASVAGLAALTVVIHPAPSSDGAATAGPTTSGDAAFAAAGKEEEEEASPQAAANVAMEESSR